MARYFVNKNAQSTGEHEVHKEGCPTPPLPSNRLHLGDFSTCARAVAEAAKHFRNVDGCRNCIPECHTR